MTLGCQNMLSYLGCLLVHSPSPKAIKYRVHAAHSVTQSCLTLCNPIDCSPPGSSFHGIFQAGMLEWVAISYSRGSSGSRDWTHVSCISFIGRQILYYWATWEAPQIQHGWPQNQYWRGDLIHKWLAQPPIYLYNTNMNPYFTKGNKGLSLND